MPSTVETPRAKLASRSVSVQARGAVLPANNREKKKHLQVVIIAAYYRAVVSGEALSTQLRASTQHRGPECGVSS